MSVFLAVLMVLGMATAGYGKIVTEAVSYRQDNTELEGFLAYDDSVKGKRPGVLVVHEFWGLNKFAKDRAEKLAAQGYVAFAVDMYGKGKVTENREEAVALASHVRGTPLMRERARAGLKVLAQNSRVDPQRLAAIGFCFGGTAVLELAYSGADVRGVVSFHGGLTAPKPEDMNHIKASILVLHGADDPLVKQEDISAFQEAMRQAKADWQMILFGGTVHSFTNPEAVAGKVSGVAYDPRSAARSFKYMELFFQEILAGKRGAP
jgi:dienelactone hydrolase